MSRVYRELSPPADLAPWVRCVWVATDPAGDETRWVVPDGCLDLMWLGGELVVAGPDDLPHRYRPRPSTASVMGVRFQPGRAGPLLREQPERLRNQRVACSALGPAVVDALDDRLAAATDPAGVLALLTAEVRARAAGAAEPDAVGTAAAELLLASGGRLTMGGLATELAVSERHLRRRATEALGYGPKTFARIVRFQRALDLLGSGQPPAAVAALAGYADQAHLTREVVALAGRTPGEVHRPACVARTPEPADPGRFVQEPGDGTAVA
jgi:AraC-like DNA-binding protein